MAGIEPRRPGAFVVSLDFELAWGLGREARDGYLRNLEGARVVVPRLLSAFAGHGVAATWAAVGFLFSRSRTDLRQWSPPPALRPAYRGGEPDPYAEPVGESEQDDPLHYAPGLIDRIRDTPRQEIATHTFSHYYCLSRGQSADAFRADLSAARAIAADRGIDIVSIVFPRNQHNPGYDAILAEQGIRAYRGVPRTWTWRLTEPDRPAGATRRAARLLDSYVNLTGHGAYDWREVLQPSGLSDVRASHFLRASSRHSRGRSSFQLQRTLRALRAAARRGQIYHLWWHPHNFGRHIEENLSIVREILEEFTRLRDEHGMVSLSMRDVDATVRDTEDTCGSR